MVAIVIKVVMNDNDDGDDDDCGDDGDDCDDDNDCGDDDDDCGGDDDVMVVCATCQCSLRTVEQKKPIQEASDWGFHILIWL